MENLLRQRDELTAKIGELDRLSTTGTEKILQAIQNQRWFFFSNKPKVLMDRDTALLWADLNYFPYGKNNNIYYYSNSNSYSEVKNLLSQKNSESWGGFNDWKIPTPFELWKMIKDKTFPFTGGGNWRIKERDYWCVNNNGLAGKDLDANGATTDISIRDVCVIPCSHAYVPTDYENNISPSNNFYTEKEKLQFMLNVFVQNNLIPMFNDAAITQLYRKIFIEKPALTKQLAELEAQIAELQRTEIKLTANFNYRPILAKYDAAAVAKLPIKYSDAVIKIADEFLDILQEYALSQSDTFAEISATVQKFDAQIDAANLTADEKSLLVKRQEFFAGQIDTNVVAATKQILSVKTQAEKFFTRLDEINHGDNPIAELAALQAEPRADFEFVVENLARTILDVQHRVDFFTVNKNLIATIIDEQTAWHESYLTFKTNRREEFSASCRDENIDEEIFAAWFDDWQTKRFAIEKMFLPLVEFVFKGNLVDSVEYALKILRNCRDAVDEFYLHGRKELYQKFSDEARETLETARELYRLTENFQRQLQEIIFSRDNAAERIFLLKWSEPLADLSIDETINLLRKNNLPEEISAFDALKQQKFFGDKIFLSDKVYDAELSRRAEIFNATVSKVTELLAQH